MLLISLTAYSAERDVNKAWCSSIGGNIEFRTTLEFSYQLESKDRIGLSFGHISNANIGDKNPGVEIISLSYQVPFN